MGGKWVSLDGFCILIPFKTVSLRAIKTWAQVKYDILSDKSCHKCMKLQLLCGARIELAVGPGKSGFPIASPGRDGPLSGFPICKPCLDARQNSSRDTHFPSYGRRPLPKPKPKIKLY